MQNFTVLVLTLLVLYCIVTNSLIEKPRRISLSIRSVSSNHYVGVQSSSTYLFSLNNDEHEEDEEEDYLAIKWFRRPQQREPLLFTPINSKNVREIPIYPVDYEQAFPTGEIPLYVYVMKYRQLMNDINQKDSLFGIVMGSPSGKMCEYGTIVQNSFRKLLDSGKQFCLNEGKSRFRLLEIVQEEPYMIGKVEFDVPDLDVLHFKNSLGFLPPDILTLEREVWQTLQDVVNLNNRILESQLTTLENIEDVSSGIDSNDNDEEINIFETISDSPDTSASNNRKKMADDYTLSKTLFYEISTAAEELSPDSIVIRLKVATDFSFAVSDMLDLDYKEKQQLLQCSTLKRRLWMLKQHLAQLRSYLMLKAASSLEEPFN